MNYSYNEPWKFIPIFQFTNITFATTKNEALSEGQASAL